MGMSIIVKHIRICLNREQRETKTENHTELRLLEYDKPYGKWVFEMHTLKESESI